MTDMIDLSVGLALPTADATTPVTYSIKFKDSSLVSWTDKTLTTFLFRPVYSVSLREATAKVPIRKVIHKLTIPVIRTISSVDTKVSSIDYDVNIRVNGDCTDAEIDAANIRFINLMRQSAVLNVAKGNMLV